MLSFKSLLLTLPLLFICDASIVNNLQKCSTSNSECIRRSYQQIIHDSAKTGIPELSIPPYDPFQLTNVSIVFMQNITITITQGSITGIENCTVTNFTVDTEKFTAFQEIKCDDLNINGDFLVFGTGELVARIIGGYELHLRGRGKVNLENVYVSYVFPFGPFKRDDEEIYFEIGTEEINYKYDIGKVTFYTKDVYRNNVTKELSDLINEGVNGYWKLILKEVGPTALNHVKDIYFAYATKLFKFVPAKNIFVDNLAPLVKKYLNSVGCKFFVYNLFHICDNSISSLVFG